MSLDHRIRAFKPDAVLDEDYVLRDDGDGPFIDFWNEEKLGPKPNIDDLPDGTQVEEKDSEDREALEMSVFEAELFEAIDKLARGQPVTVDPKRKKQAEDRKALPERRRG